MKIRALVSELSAQVFILCDRKAEKSNRPHVLMSLVSQMGLHPDTVWVYKEIMTIVEAGSFAIGKIDRVLQL